MGNFKRLLAASDFSERSARAETRAAMLCAQLNCVSLDLLTVNDSGVLAALASVLDDSQLTAKRLLLSGAERELEQKARQLQEAHGIRVEHHVRQGRPVTEILAKADQLPADLIAIGAHGGNAVTDLFLGNNADKLVCLGKRPLLIVKREPERSYEKVLVPVDFSEDSIQSARLALEIAPNAHITFLHAFTVPFEGQMHGAGIESQVIHQYRVKAAEEARRNLNQFIEDLGPRSQLLSRTIAFGYPVPVICEAARSMRPDLIALGKHGRSRLEELLLGSVTRRIVDQVDCDVLVSTVPDDSGEWYDRTAA